MTRPISRTFHWFGRYTRGLGTCGGAGLIVGLITGATLMLLHFVEGGSLELGGADLFWTALILGVFGWIVVVFIFAVLQRYEMSSVALPILVNALIVSFLTTYLISALEAWEFGWLLGLLVGVLVGRLLCALSRLYTRVKD